MKSNTKKFGEIEIADDRIITFEGGIVGFPELTKFALLHDSEKSEGTGIHWLQSMQEEGFAMPVMNPLLVAKDYNPEVEDELLKPLGEVGEEGLLVLVTVTVPADLTKMSVNLQGPIIVNPETCKAGQIIVDSGQHDIKYPIYEILRAQKKVGE